MAVDGSASFCYAGSNPGTDTIHAFVDNDQDGTQDADEPEDTSTQEWISEPQVDSLVLEPEDSTNPINTNHTVTATVTDGGTPVAGRAGRVRDKGRQRHL